MEIKSWEYLDPIESLAHYGVKGQKWGVRRYQNYDGTRKLGALSSLKRDPVRRESIKNSKAFLSAMKHGNRNHGFEEISDVITRNPDFDSMRKRYSELDKVRKSTMVNIRDAMAKKNYIKAYHEREKFDKAVTESDKIVKSTIDDVFGHTKYDVFGRVSDVLPGKRKGFGEQYQYYSSYGSIVENTLKNGKFVPSDHKKIKQQWDTEFNMNGYPLPHDPPFGVEMNEFVRYKRKSTQYEKIMSDYRNSKEYKKAYKDSYDADLKAMKPEFTNAKLEKKYRDWGYTSPIDSEAFDNWAYDRVDEMFFEIKQRATRAAESKVPEPVISKEIDDEYLKTIKQDWKETHRKRK